MINPEDKISTYFTMKEALWLPQWNRMACESDGLSEEVISNLKVLFSKLDVVRDFFKLPIIVHVAYRPEEYNKLVKGAKNSAHKHGCAVDFHLSSMNCDTARFKILQDKALEKLELRMEDLPGSGWIHLDTYKPNPNRFFKP